MRDSARAGEPQQTELKAAAVAANPITHFPKDPIRLCRADSLSDSLAAASTFHFRLPRWLEFNNRQKRIEDEMGVGRSVEDGEKRGSLKSRVGRRASIVCGVGCEDGEKRYKEEETLGVCWDSNGENP